MESYPASHANADKAQISRAETAEMLRQVIRLNAQILGVTLGLLSSIGIFFATNILVLKGGSQVGLHLGLLGNYFPGYTVTFGGSLIGVIYAWFVGYFAGWVIGSIYNWIVVLRSR